MKKVLLVLGVLAILAIAGTAFASGQATEELQPYYRLMDGDEELGVVYALDYGWLILTEEDTLYVCDCNEGVCDATEGFEVVVPTEAPKNNPTLEPTGQEPTSVPTISPTNTPEPTSPPTVEPTDKPKCNAGRGNGSEGNPDCDPGNSGGHNQGGD